MHPRLHLSAKRYLAAMGLPTLMLSSTTCSEELVAATPPSNVGASSLAPSVPSATTTTTPNAQASSSPPYTDWAKMPWPQSPGGGFCGDTVCASEPLTGPITPAPPPFQRCDVSPTGFSAMHTAEHRNEGERTACCYLHWRTCSGPMGGRPFRRDGGEVVTAPTRRSPDWGSVAVQLDGGVLRKRLWLRDAAFEHASAASFARFSLQLIALGAPPELVAAAHHAALDEIEHARGAYDIASSYAGVALGPGPFTPSESTTSIDLGDLADFARETIHDGCVGESIAAQLARELAEVCEEPSVRSFLERIAEDEERHAELAFRAVAWAVRSGGLLVAARARRILDRLRIEPATVAGLGEDDANLEPHGRAGLAMRNRVTTDALHHVVAPCLEALLTTCAA